MFDVLLLYESGLCTLVVYLILRAVRFSSGLLFLILCVQMQAFFVAHSLASETKAGKYDYVVRLVARLMFVSTVIWLERSRCGGFVGRMCCVLFVG